MWAGSVSAKGNHPVVARLDDKSLMVFYPSTQAGREAIFIALLANLIGQKLKEAVGKIEHLFFRPTSHTGVLKF